MTEATLDSSIADRLLRCPRCKGTLGRTATAVTCEPCRVSFDVEPGPMPIYHLYVDDTATTEIGRDPSQRWDRERFEEDFHRIGYHESGEEFDRQLGYPKEISEFLYERVKGRMLRWVEPGPDHHVLDVGCGAGYFLHAITEEYRKRGFTPHLSGIEISTTQLSYMVHRMKKEGDRDVLAVHGSGEYLPFADGSFDLVTCSEVLEHIRNPERALTEMRRVLKPTGLLLLSTPSMSAQRGWGWVLAPISIPVKILTRHKHVPAADQSYDVPWYAGDFRKTVRSAGLQIRDFEYNAVAPHPWHFRFLPAPLVKPVVRLCEAADRFLKFAMKPLALHFVVRAVRSETARPSSNPRGRL